MMTSAALVRERRARQAALSFGKLWRAFRKQHTRLSPIFPSEWHHSFLFLFHPFCKESLQRHEEIYQTATGGVVGRTAVCTDSPQPCDTATGMIYEVPQLHP